jgi:NADPH:quinone reductase
MAATKTEMLALQVASGAKPSIRSVPKPQPQAEKAIVKVIAAGLTPSDILNFTGGFAHAKSPRILGRDYSGIVEAGPSSLVGTEVYGTSGSSLSFERDGTNAEYCSIPVACLAPKPLNLSRLQAATVGVPFTTAALALERAQTKLRMSFSSLERQGTLAQRFANWQCCKAAESSKRPVIATWTSTCQATLRFRQLKS